MSVMPFEGEMALMDRDPNDLNKHLQVRTFNKYMI